MDEVDRADPIHFLEIFASAKTFSRRRNRRRCCRCRRCRRRRRFFCGGRARVKKQLGRCQIDTATCVT